MPSAPEPVPSIAPTTATTLPDGDPLLDPNRQSQRSPAIAAAIAFGIGIGCDSLLSLPFVVSTATALAFACLAAIGLYARWRRLAAISLLICGLCLGAARHHWFWSTARSDDVARFANTDTSVPVHLTGRVDAAPVIVPRREERIPSAWVKTKDRTFCRIESLEIKTNSGSERVSGMVRLQVSGHLPRVEVGDVVEVRGWLRAPGGPMNPGAFDYAEHLRRKNIRAVVYAENPAAVKVVKRAGWSIRRATGWLRRRCEQILERHLSPRTVAVGSAMLLGDRSQLDEQIKTAFIQSGMIHILAISGLHVGVLALFAWLLFRAMNFSTRTTTFLMLATLLSYLLITDIRPSVVRATVMIALMVLGRPWNRTTNVWNSLAIAVIVVLAWRPTDLFNAGAQLSFLSVVAIVTSESWWRRLQERRSPLKRLQERGPISGVAHWIGRWTLRSALMMAAIWLFTAPLVAARFHVVSPIGMAINIVLVPAIGIGLAAGHLLLLTGLVLPDIAFLPAAVFDTGLHGLLAIVEGASSLRLGHVALSGPGDLWLAGYYASLAANIVIGRRLRVQTWGWCAICGWTIFGLSGGTAPKPPEGLRCTFLSTGHGVAVFIEAPNGKTLLYDAGCLAGAHRATQSVKDAVWHRGHSRLDAIVISHADVDHFNGVPALLETIPVGRVLIAQSFLDMGQKSVAVLCDAAKTSGVPIGILMADDRIELDENVEIRVLHPRRSVHESDNANSIVLEINYAGRRILLTGDLENEGMSELLSLPPRKTDAMLSPHHGSPKANPAKLARWARPRYVVVSGGQRVKLDVLRKTYGSDSRVMSTHKGGAVTFEIGPGGTMTVQRGASD